MRNGNNNSVHSGNSVKFCGNDAGVCVCSSFCFVFIVETASLLLLGFRHGFALFFLLLLLHI